ncbi:MAG: bifunctional DNA-formamidopyrimidine glycosylase/DNA-(apurinic or apyrimidinic site) lyase [Thermoanaerobaculaceae bacterium]|jgi:formamidopyrimidine-DNA glycosylase|nr:bifunctional DNA-formamidopyrimidine glycosylase/DNA-(apurinic or apyrimidinic site) lyase [Thermoanaerobaculaceae bacterium]
MPELPEVETVRRTVSAALLGCRAEGVGVATVKMRLPLDGERWRRLVPGRRLEALDRRGKYLLARFEDTGAVVHLGMSGRLLVAAPGQPVLPHTHLVVHFEGGRELWFVDPRRFGFAVVMPVEGLKAFPPLPELGPDPLTGDVEGALAAAACRQRAPVRSILLDQRVLAGIGNIYACEALFRAGIRPQRSVAELGARRRARLAVAVREVLQDALAAGGTTLADGGFSASDGQAGYFAVQLAVYGREGAPCRRCSRPVRRQALGGRSAYYCPSCQR